MKQTGRIDLDWIASLIPPGARVLDLGCGDGTLLAHLAETRNVRGRGVEISETNVRICIGRGVRVRHGNIEEGLADHPAASFDYVILSRTIDYLDNPEPVVRDMLRVGKQVIISFDNDAHWRARMRAAFGGGYGPDLVSGHPRSRGITVAQFCRFCRHLSARIEHELFLTEAGRIGLFPELRARVAMYVLSSNREAENGIA